MEDTTVLFPAETGPRQVNLGAAFDAGVLPTWTEAVALTRAVAWQLYRAGATAPVPELGDIALFSSGVVHIEGGGVHPDGQVAGVGAVMGELLEHVSAPPQVTDVQRQALASPPVYATLMEFHNALDFFARPDSKAVLVDYHTRADAALQQTDKNSALEELKEKTKAAPKEQRKKKKERKRPPVWVVAAAAVVVATIAGVAVYYLTGQQEESSAVRQSASAALQAIGDVGQKVQEATNNVVSKLIGGVSDPASSNASPANVSPVTPPAAPKRRQPPAAVATSTTRVPSESVANPPPTAASSTATSSTTSAPIESLPPPPVDTGVYTVQDSDVAAPELVYPQLPTKRVSETMGQPGELDILVLEDGTVAEARLIPQSDRLQDRMLVSAAKAWRFRPALKDGRAVRYRVRIPITW